MPHPASRLLLLDGVCLLALGLAALRLLHGLEQVVDLPMHDEALYLGQGLRLGLDGLPEAEWGPLHALWYALVGRLVAEPVALYDVSSKLLALLTTWGAYAAMRALGARAEVSLVGAALYLLSLGPHVVPRPALVGLLVLEGAVVLAARAHRRGPFLGVLGLAGLVASFARPEYFLSFLLLSAWLLGEAVRGAVREGRVPGPVAAGLAVYALAALLLMHLLGNPFGNTSGRRLYAFCQHFALTHVERTGAPLNPWGECQRVLDDAFGAGLEGVGQALRRNPAALAGHVAHNLVHYPLASLGHLVGGSREGVLPGPGRVLSGWLHALLLALALWQGVRLGARPRQLPALLARPGVRRAGVALAVFALPTVASCLLIYPRQHYLPVQTALGLAFLAVLVSAAARPAPQPARQAGLAVALLAGLLVVSVPRLAEAARPPQGPLRHRTVVRFLASPAVSALLPQQERVGVLEVQNGYASYLGPRFRQVYLPARPGGFAALLEEEPVHLVVLDAALRADRRLAGDAGFAAFVQRPEAFGFRLLEVPGTDVQVAVRAGRG